MADPVVPMLCSNCAGSRRNADIGFGTSIMSKRRDMPYRSGRSRTWLKKNPDSAAVRRERAIDWHARRSPWR